MVRCRCVVWALALGLAGCGDDGPGAAPGSTGTTDAPTATMVSTSSSDGADETATTGTPSPTCDDSTPAFVDPLRLVGSDAPGLTGLVAVTAAGSFVYGCSHDAGLTVWSVADPAAPTVVATGLSAAADDPPRCDAVALSEDGSQLVTARRPIDGDGGVTVWTLGDPAMPSMQAHWATMLAVESAVMGAGRVWVAAGPDGVRSLALDLDQLVEQGSYVDEDSDARGLAIDGDMLLVAEAREGLRVYDVAPDEPVLQGTVGLGAVAVDVRISEDRAHVATLEAVAVVDIADPAAPDLIVQLPTQGPALDLTRHDDLLLVADWDEIRGISVADPDLPQLRLGEPAPGSDPLDRARAVTMADGHLVVSGWRGIHVYEVESDPQAPELEVESLRVDFRTVASGESDDHVVVLRNTGNVPLTLCGMESTLPGLEIEPLDEQIDAAATLPVEIVFTAQSEDPVQGELFIYTNDPDQPMWTIPVTANTARLDIGDPGIAFHHVDLQGRAWSSDDFAGQVRLYAYFASWCPTCNTEFPGYEADLWQVYAEQGLAVVGLGNEPVGKLLAFGDSVEASFPLLMAERSYRDWEDPPGGSYSLQIVLDRDGVVQAIGNELTSTDLEPLIEQLLAR